jgi:hypothetical protein
MQPPSSFLVTMEEYIREAPRASIGTKYLVSAFNISALRRILQCSDNCWFLLNQEYEEQNQPSDDDDEEEEAPQETDKPVEEEKQEYEEAEEEPQPVAEPAEQVIEPQVPMTTGNLLVRLLCFFTNFLSFLAPVSLNPHEQVIVLPAELGRRSKPLDCRS